MKDKVSELRDILKKQKTAAEQNEISSSSETGEEMTETASVPESPTQSPQDDWKTKYEEALKANETQKDMYLRKVAEFENFRKRLIKEQEEQAKFAGESIISEIIPILDSLEMTLSHAQQKADDPLILGVRLILKQFLQTLEKLGVKEIAGEGESFDPNVQEAIGTEQKQGVPAGVVTKIHRKGYVLRGRLIRAALVTVSV